MLSKKLSNRRHLSIQIPEEFGKSLLNQTVRPQGFSSFKRNIGITLAFHPHIHRNAEHPMTDFETFLNLIKCALGTGCLAMPRAYCNAGWLVGLISTIVISSFVVYAMHVLLNDINDLCKRYRIALLNYSETMQLAVLCGPYWMQPMSRPFGYMVDLFLCVYHFGVDCVYVVFIAKNLKHLGDMYFISLDIRLYMALLTLPLILTFLIRDLKYLVPFAIISNILIIVCFGIVLSYMLGNLPSLQQRHASQSLTQYPLFFGTVLFAIESVGVILALQRNMITPQNYLGPFGVLNRAMILVIIFYTLFGFMGYWRYGDNTASSILNNLPLNERLPQCAIVMFALGIFFSYALQGYVTMDIIWRYYMEPQLKENATRSLEYLVRIALVVASVLVAIGYPDFGLLLAFVGSFCLAQLGLIYPGIVHLCVRYEEGYGICKFKLFRSLLFIIVGLFGGIAGSIASVKALTEQYASLM
ncbi:proton-coupled amino acid transporter-like protein CG1139 isoform X2 [Drosophila willistoni]|uniref:proton-coupled amino acid transporter-like protein CG1139 isoform X2 n=1 Tax=Drosophila willistoni TaxID=7260 RepID=UPI000C26C73B|nr:proton-coupled amino acid transporter-like protein CG1139 isoform X2 [Drosophila willistoni]